MIFFKIKIVNGDASWVGTDGAWEDVSSNDDEVSALSDDLTQSDEADRLSMSGVLRDILQQQSAQKRARAGPAAAPAAKKAAAAAEPTLVWFCGGRRLRTMVGRWCSRCCRH